MTVTENSIFGFVDRCVGDDFNGRLFAHEAVILKAALRQVPEDLWGGEWGEKDLTMLAVEVSDMFADGTTNAEILEMRLTGTTRRFDESERLRIEAYQAVFVRQFDRMVNRDAVEMRRRRTFLKTVFVLLLTFRRYPILVIINGGRHDRRLTQMEWEEAHGRFRLVSSA